MASENSTKITDEVIERAIIGTSKAQNFTFLIYPDSAQENWKELLEELGQPIAISPLHDMDKAELGGFKKSHYHCIYRANNNVTADSVRKKIQRKLGVKAVAKVQIVDNIQNMYLYLTHESKDAVAKNKHVYDKKDIVLLNNFDIERYIVFDVEELSEKFDIICDIILDNELANMVQLMTFLKENGTEYGFTNRRLIRKVVESRTGLLRLYFDGVYQEQRNKIEREKALAEQRLLEIPVVRSCKKSSYPPSERGKCTDECHCYDDKEDSDIDKA